MTDLVFLGNGIQAKPIDPQQMEVYDVILASGSDRPVDGDAIYFDPTGRAKKATSDAESTANCAGIVVQTLGMGATVLIRGRIGGFSVNHLPYGAVIYLSDEPGKLSDEAGTTEVPVGVVVPVSDDYRTKVIYINVPFWRPSASVVIDDGNGGGD